MNCLLNSKIFSGMFVIVLTAQIALPALAEKSTGGHTVTAGKTKTRVAHKAAAKMSKEDLAVDLVWKRPEVKKWLKQFPGGTSKLGGHAAATADLDKGYTYNVHVYEDLPDHTATFNWYSVDLKTGKVTKQI